MSIASFYRLLRSLGPFPFLATKDKPSQIYQDKDCRGELPLVGVADKLHLQGDSGRVSSEVSRVDTQKQLRAGRVSSPLA